MCHAAVAPPTGSAGVLDRLKQAARGGASGSRPACFIAATTRARLARLTTLAAASRVPLIAVNDVLYHAPERRALQDV